MKKIVLIALAILLMATPVMAKKAIFIVTWANGTPQLPADIQIDGISAMKPVTGSGAIKAQIEASVENIEALKAHLTWVEDVEEGQ